MALNSHIVERMFNENPKTPFVIRTSESVGRGINGVKFTEYPSSYAWEDTTYSRRIHHQKTTIVEIRTECLVLDFETDDNIYNPTKERVYLPYDIITSISFILEDTYRQHYTRKD